MTTAIAPLGPQAISMALPPTVTRALKAIGPWAGMRTFELPDTLPAGLDELLAAATGELAAMSAPTPPEAVIQFMETFATRRGFTLPSSEVLAMDALVIADAVPADLFPKACEALWSTFAYRRLPEAPDFSRAIEPHLTPRRRAQAQIQTLWQKLALRAQLGAVRKTPCV